MLAFKNWKQEKKKKGEKRRGRKGGDEGVGGAAAAATWMDCESGNANWKSNQKQRNTQAKQMQSFRGK